MWARTAQSGVCAFFLAILPGTAAPQPIDEASSQRLSDSLKMVLFLSTQFGTEFSEKLKMRCMDASGTIEEIEAASPRDTGIGSGPRNHLRTLQSELARVCDEGANSLEKMGLRHLVRNALLARTLQGQTLAELLDETGGSNWSVTLSGI